MTRCRIPFFAAALLCAASTSHGASYVRNASGNWSVTNQWNDNRSGSYVVSTTLPGAADTVVLNNNRTVDLDLPATVATVQMVNNALNATLRIQAPNTLAASNLLMGHPSGTGTSTVQQAAGTVSLSGMNVAAAGPATYHLAGGTVELGGTATINSKGLLSIEGGALQASYSGQTRTFDGAGTMRIASGGLELLGGATDRIYLNCALLEIGGGTVNLGGQVWLGDGTPAEMRIVGDAASISLTTLNQQPTTAESGTFRFVFGAHGISPVRTSGFMNLSAATIIVDGSDYTGPAGTFDLFTAGNLNLLADTNRISVAGFGAFESARVVQDQATDKVQLVLEEDLSSLDNDEYNRDRLNRLGFHVNLDKDGSGTLSATEYTATAPSFAELDGDGNGEISFAEYDALVEPDGVNWAGASLRNVMYKQVGQYRGLLDIHYPTSAGYGTPAPAVVFIHGGGWVTGSKEKFDAATFLPVFARLAAEGVVCVSINYRLVFFDGDGVFMRDCVIDVKDALRYLAANAGALGIDPDRIALFGESAGAHLALMGTLTKTNEFLGVAELAGETPGPCAGLSWYGPVDFTDTNLFVVADDPSINPNRWDARIGASREDHPELFEEVSPVLYLTNSSPPLFLVHGTDDTTIPILHAYAMTNQADRVGARVDFMEVAGAGHNWREASAPLDPPLAEIQQQTANFLLARLQPQTYVGWAAGFWLHGAMAAYGSDPDSDGVDNLAEYALGGIPTRAGDPGIRPAFLVDFAEAPPAFDYVHRRRRDAVARHLSYRVEASDALVSPVWSTNGISETGTAVLDDAFEWVTNRVPMGAENSRFVQLKIGVSEP